MTELAKVLGDHVGRQQEFCATEELGAAAIRYFAIATEDANPLFHDPLAAAKTRHGGMIAPPTLICETNQILGGAAGKGSDGVDWALPLDGWRFMRSGNTYEFHQPTRPTDRIAVQWKITDIVERKTRTGDPAVFVTSKALFSNQDGELLATNIESNVYLK